MRRQELTRQGAFAHAVSLVEGIPLQEFWFGPPGGGAAMNTRQALAHVTLAHAEGRWQDVLKCAGAMDTMAAEVGSNTEKDKLLHVFELAYMKDRDWTAAAGFCTRQIDILGNLQRFRDQGTAICRLRPINTPTTLLCSIQLI